MKPQFSEILDLLQGTQVYDLGVDLFAGMPRYPSHPPFLYGMAKRHGDLVNAVAGREISSAVDAISMVRTSARTWMAWAISHAMAACTGMFPLRETSHMRAVLRGTAWKQSLRFFGAVFFSMSPVSSEASRSQPIS